MTPSKLPYLGIVVLLSVDMLCAKTLPALATSDRPDIFLVLTDDQRADTLWAMPHLKAWLQDAGVTFEHSIVTSPLCCPNRASLLSGQYVRRHGVLSNLAKFGGGASKFNDTETLGVWLERAGYYTCYSGKYLNEYNETSFPNWPHVPPGWSQWSVFKQPDDTLKYSRYTLVENGTERAYVNYSTNLTAQRLRECIASAPPDQPLFALWAPHAPHEPYTPDPSDVGKFKTLMRNYPPSFNETDVSDKPGWIQVRPLFTGSQISGMLGRWRKYHESLLAVDRQLETTFTLLQSLNRLDVAIYTSDNGLTFGEHRLAEGKNCAYEECLRVPLVIRTNETAQFPGRVNEMYVVSTIDLTATILDYAEAEAGLPQDGLSLRPLLDHFGAYWPDERLIEYFGVGNPSLRRPFVAVRGLTDVYTELLSDTFQPTGKREYYNLLTDPWELQNRVTDPAVAERVQVLAAKLAILRTP